MYAVMGITGQVGGAVANALLQRGEKVRAIVRNAEKASEWKARGVEIALADADDPETLKIALSGVDGAFIMIPPNFAPTPGFLETRTTLASLHKALSEAPPKKAVYLSSIGSEQTHGLGLITSTHLLEEQLGSLPIPSAFLRAGWFMENSLWDVTAAREQSKFFSYLQPLDKGFSLVATEDIGRTGAEVLLQEWSGNRYIEVAGPRQYSPYEIAEAFALVLGHSVETIAVPREEWVQKFVEQGMPKDRTAPRIEMVEGFNSGWIHFGVPGTEHVIGQVELKDVLQKLVTRA